MPGPFTRKKGQRMVAETQTTLQGNERVSASIWRYQRQSEKIIDSGKTVQAQGKQMMLNILYAQIDETENMPEFMGSKSNSSTE